MAVGQYTAFFVARACVARPIAGETADVLDTVEECWRVHQPPDSYTQTLQAALRRGETWHESVEVWGDLTRNCVVLSRDGARVESIYFRLDARVLDETFLRTVVAFAQHCDCVILQPNREVVEPDLDSLRAAVDRSHARLFYTNRKEYFRLIDVMREQA